MGPIFARWRHRYAFSLEGFAFFLEAIFLGVYLYGWDRLRPSAHVFGLPPALAQPLAGDWAGKVLAHTQPAKLAALEGHFESETYAPVHLGGIPDVEAQQTRRDRDHKRLHVTTRRL